ncbi:uncharacterized protein LOC144527577 [Sander vitreus]
MSLMVLEAKWKTALSSILEELTESEFRKMLFNLVKIPQGVKDGKAREEIPYLIVQHYGTQGSISVIDKEMKNIPRQDAAVQEPLRPFVEKLKKQRQGKKETTRKLSIDFGSVAKKPKLAADQLKSCQPDQKKTVSQLVTKALGCKTFVQSSAQCTNKKKWKMDPVKAAKPKKKPKKKTETQDSSLKHQTSASASINMDPVGDVKTEKKTEEQDSSLKPVESSKTFKVPSAAVQTGRIQIMRIKKSNKTNTHLVVEFNKRKRNVFVTTRLLANTFGLKVDDDFERRLCCQMPLTAEATLQGKKVTDIKKMDPVGDVKPDQKTEEHDSSLKLAASSKTFKVQSAAVRTGRIQIMRIKKSNKTNTHLVVEFNGRTRTFFLTNRLLANAFGLEVDDDFERRLCLQMPLTAEATIQGKKKITDIKKMDSVGAVTTEQKTENKDASLKPAESSKTSKMDPVGAVKPKKKTGSRSVPETNRNLQGNKRKREEEKEELIDLTSDHTEIPILEIFDGKVVQKSGLRTYKTKNKEKKVFFYLAVADKKASVKVMVYGKKRFQEIREQSSYLFKKLIIDEYGVKVTKSSKVAETSPVDVPEELAMEALKLIYPESPMYSIKEAKLSADKTDVTVEGTITEIDPVQKTESKDDTERGFQLKDETDSIDIFMWGDATEQCNGLSVGDVVKVTNMKIHQFFETTLNSTVYSRIEKVQSVGTKNVRIEIIGILKANQEETYLEAEFKNQPHMFVVDSPLLAKTFGFKLDEDFEESLLDEIPLSADAEIQGTISLNSTVYSRIEKMDPVEQEEQYSSLEAAESSKPYKMSSRLLEKRWKRALSSILEKLTEQQFAKMVFNLVKIPVKLKTDKARRYISYLIFEHFGTEGSISEIDKIMKMIPVNDAAVQKLLRPFVEELKEQRQEEKGTTSNHASGPGSVTKKPKNFL